MGLVDKLVGWLVGLLGRCEELKGKGMGGKAYLLRDGIRALIGAERVSGRGG